MSKLKNFFKEYYIYFIIPIVITVIYFFVYKINEIYPFGRVVQLKSDGIHQIFPFFKEFQRRLKTHTLSDYTWTMGLGSNYYALACYYLMSPINLLLYFVPSSKVVIFIMVITLVKIILCGESFAIYLSRKYEEKNILTIVFALCYALCSYIVCYQMLIMWLDALIFFPLIMLGLESAFDNGKHKLYFWILFACIISNYYMGATICLFIAVYVIILFLTEKNKKEKIKNILSIGFYSFFAVLCSSFVIIPSAYQLFGGNVVNQSMEILNPFVSIGEFFSRHLMLIPKEINDHFPNVYCSVIVIAAIPLYFINTKIFIKNKIRNGLVIIFLNVSMMEKYLYLYAHVFRVPRGFDYRNSFIYIFFILVISYEAIIKIKEIKDFLFIISAGFSSVSIVFLWKFILKSKEYEMAGVLSTFFLVVYLICIYLLKNFNKIKNIIYILVLLAVSYELFVNTKGIDVGTKDADEMIYDSYFNADIKNIDNDKDLFFRANFDQDDIPYLYNTGASYGFNAINCTSSTLYDDMNYFYSRVGIAFFAEKGTTPFLRSLFDVKYVMSSGYYVYRMPKSKYNIDMMIKKNESEDYSNDSNLEVLNKDYYLTNSIYTTLYKNKYPFSLGFFIKENNKLEYGDDFAENLNVLYNIINNNDDNELYTKLRLEENDLKENIVDEMDGVIVKKLSVKEDEDIILCISSIRRFIDEEIEYYIKRNDEEIVDWNFFSCNVLNIDDLKKGDEIYFIIPRYIKDTTDYLSDNKFVVSAYKDNHISMEKCYNNLKDGFLDITYMKNDVIKGNIHAKDNGYMFTSIPYDRGWKVYVDGKKVKTERMFSAFLSVPISEGNHKITMKYTAPGKVLGFVISIFGFIIVMVIDVIDWKKSKNKDLD